MTFSDAKGRQYAPRITVQVLRDFESRAGVRVFECLFDSVADLRGRPEGSDLSEPTLRLLGRIFPTIDSAMFLAYRSSVKPGEAGAPTFDEFCEAMGIEQMGAMLDQAIKALNDQDALAQHVAEIQRILKAGDNAQPTAANG